MSSLAAQPFQSAAWNLFIPCKKKKKTGFWKYSSRLTVGSISVLHTGFSAQLICVPASLWKMESVWKRCFQKQYPLESLVNNAQRYGILRDTCNRKLHRKSFPVLIDCRALRHGRVSSLWLFCPCGFTFELSRKPYLNFLTPLCNGTAYVVTETTTTEKKSHSHVYKLLSSGFFMSRRRSETQIRDWTDTGKRNTAESREQHFWTCFNKSCVFCNIGKLALLSKNSHRTNVINK